MSWGTLKVGRITLSETYTLNDAVNASSGDRSIALNGTETNPKRLLPELLALAEDLGTLLKQVLPVTFSQKPERNGYYSVRDVNVSALKWVGEAASVTWSLSLDYMGPDNAVDIESRLMMLERTNVHSVAGERWHAPAVGAYAYYTGAARPTAVTERQTPDGPIAVYRSLPLNVNPRWGVGVGDFMKGSAKVYTDNILRAGIGITAGLSNWEINNGIMSVRPGVNGTINVGAFNATTGTFVYKAWNLGIGSATDGLKLSDFDAVTILRNDPEAVAIRIIKDYRPGRATVDLTLNRGAKFVECFIQSDVAVLMGAWLDIAEAATTGVGYVVATSNDANGMRFTAGSSKAFTAHADGGLFSTATVTAYDLYMGVASSATALNSNPGMGDPTMLPAAFTILTFNDPARTVVTEVGGLGRTCTLTNGCRTAVFTGMGIRSLIEQKKPFTDTFTRDQPPGTLRWGNAPGGGSWRVAITGQEPQFTLNGNQGVCAVNTINTAFYTTLNDPIGLGTTPAPGDFDAFTDVTLDEVPVGAACSESFLFGYQDTSNHYRALLVFNTTGTLSLSIVRFQASVATTIHTENAGSAVSVGSGFVANQMWRIRVTRSGGNITARAHKVVDPDPGVQCSATDSTWLHGRFGKRSIANTGNTNQPYNSLTDQFVVSSCSWVNPPTITHDKYVHLLPYKFNGVVDTQWVASAMTNTDDLLGWAMKFITGAAVVLSGGNWKFGDAGYGPLDAFGNRIEGADWSDYIGISWTYPNGEVDPPEGNQLHCLDCSGLLRMLFGRLGGMPMTLSNPFYFDGDTIPRRAVDMSGPSGPGMIIDKVTAPVTANVSKLQVGDCVFFDADTSNPDEDEGQIDHAGLYLGQDTAGFHRFISGRKAPDGPTFGDCGGYSKLGATGLYSNTFRQIRRF